MNDFIMHFGIKGQQWGVRRYQNEDGSLTEEGRRRYLEEIGASQRIANRAIDRFNRDLPQLNKKWGNIDTQNDHKKNLEYTREVRDMYQKYYREELAKDIGTDPSKLEGQKWLNSMFYYKTSMDDEVSRLEKKVNKTDKKPKKEASSSSSASAKASKIINDSSNSKASTSSIGKYTNKKMPQQKAYETAYSDLEKMYPNFNKLSQDKQDELFFDYIYESDLVKWM